MEVCGELIEILSKPAFRRTEIEMFPTEKIRIKYCRLIQ